MLWTSSEDAPLDASLRRLYGHVQLGDDTREDPGYVGETRSLSWPGNTLESSQKTWNMWLWTEMSGPPCISFCHRNPTLEQLEDNT